MAETEEDARLARDAKESKEQSSHFYNECSRLQAERDAIEEDLRKRTEELRMQSDHAKDLEKRFGSLKLEADKTAAELESKSADLDDVKSQNSDYEKELKKLRNRHKDAAENSEQRTRDLEELRKKLDEAERTNKSQSKQMEEVQHRSNDNYTRAYEVTQAYAKLTDAIEKAFGQPYWGISEFEILTLVAKELSELRQFAISHKSHDNLVNFHEGGKPRGRVISLGDELGAHNFDSASDAESDMIDDDEPTMRPDSLTAAKETATTEEYPGRDEDPPANATDNAETLSLQSSGTKPANTNTSDTRVSRSGGNAQIWQQAAENLPNEYAALSVKGDDTFNEKQAKKAAGEKRHKGPPPVISDASFTPLTSIGLGKWKKGAVEHIRASDTTKGASASMTAESLAEGTQGHVADDKPEQNSQNKVENEGLPRPEEQKLQLQQHAQTSPTFYDLFNALPFWIKIFLFITFGPSVCLFFAQWMAVHGERQLWLAANGATRIHILGLINGGGGGFSWIDMISFGIENLLGLERGFLC